MDIQDFFSEHKLECVLAVGAAITSLLNIGDIQAYMAANTQLRQTVSAQQVELNEQLADQATRKQFEELANLRYDGYCEPVFNLNKDGIYTALTLGQPVIKGDFVEQFRENPEALKSLQSGHVLPAGTPVCDAYGNSSTLVIAPTNASQYAGLPVIGPIAATRDQGRIDFFINKHGGSKELSAL